MTSLLTFYLPQARNDTVWSFIGSPWCLLVCWLGLMNLLAFFAFGLDKWKSKRKQSHPEVRRVPERTLFLLAALGGSAGALAGMALWRHKTRHRSFRIGIPLILLVQLLLGALALYWGVFR